MTPTTPLLEIADLVTAFDSPIGPVRAVDRISLRIQPGEAVGMVGESGCGKSVTALSVLRLLPARGYVLSGRAVFQGRDLLRLSEEEMRQVRGRQISMVFQDPMTSLNPVFTIGDQIVEAIRLHQRSSLEEARTESVRLLDRVGIADARDRMRDYPHQFSGGQRQRILIAMALACKPALLIADEPTTALDVTVQAQILDLLQGLRRDFGMAVLLISHDLSVVSEFVDRVYLMYAGQIVEEAPVDRFVGASRHPYARGLLASMPRFSASLESRNEHLPTIPGAVPDLRLLPSGCRFSDRCSFVVPRCRGEDPELMHVEDEHEVRCFEWKRVGL